MASGFELLFCAHHSKEHADKLRQVALKIHDESQRISWLIRPSLAGPVGRLLCPPIRRVHSGGPLARRAGPGLPGEPEDRQEPADRPRLRGATNLALGKRGEIYVAELFGGRISVIKNGKVTLYVTLPGALSVETDRKGTLWAGTGITGLSSIVKG
jgi:hypothetical protein